MKILFILTYYRPHWTGLTQYAARLAEGLAKKGHKVEVLCSQHDRILPLTEEINKVKIFRLPFLCKFLRSVVMPGFPLALWRRIKGNEVMVVYLPLQEVLLVALLAKFLRKKLFLVHNGDLVLPKKGRITARFVEKIYYLTTSLAIKLSNTIIVQTNDYSDHSPLLSKFKNKRKVILPLYEILQITVEEVKKFKEKFSLPEKRLIGFSGRFVEEKGIDYLLQAIPMMIKRNPDIYFIFAGDFQIQYEKYWERIKGMIRENQENITLLGLLRDPKEIFAFYRSLAVYVQPSRTDCFPSSLVEALLSGVPSICADIPGARWSIRETGMGEIVKSRNPQALAEGIFKVLKHKQKYLRHYQKVREIFDYQETLGDYERLFKES